MASRTPIAVCCLVEFMFRCLDSLTPYLASTNLDRTTDNDICLEAITARTPLTPHYAGSHPKWSEKQGYGFVDGP